MADLFVITPPVVRAEGKDVPPEQIQAGFNSLARQTQIGLNSVASDPTGPASGDLGGMYPAPTVVAVHAVGGTLDGVIIGGTTPAAGTFTTLAASTPVAVTSGGTGQNALNAHNVIIGEGSSAVGFAAPGTAGRMLISTGATTDPAFANNPVITGGTIDNAPIGQTTPAAGNFTTLAASTAIGVPSGGTGRGTLTTHGVLIGEGTAAINQTVAGTTGQMLLGVTGADPAFGNNPTITGGTIDNAVIGGTTPTAGSFTNLTATGTLTGFPGRLINIQTITTSGTYTPTAGTNSIIVELVGGGGGGGGTPATGAAQFAVGSGGGSGAFARSRITSGFSGATVTIGAAGAGASGAGGTNGTQSVFGAITAPGGGGGSAGAATTNTSSSAVTGGSAATIATGATIINAGGQMGQLALATGVIVSGSIGGASAYGGPGSPTFQGTGGAATGFGSGGGGVGASINQGAFTGGAGKQGVVIVYEFS